MDFAAKFDQHATSGLALGRDALATLAAQLSGSPVRRTEKLSGGFSNTNILVEFADGERCVLRISAQHERLKTEADLLAHLHREAPELPVPQVLLAAMDALPGDVGAFAMTYIDGEPLANVEDELTSAACRDICE